jgi:hypothetical protein
MFDQLFRYPAVVRRHRDAPFAHERATYLVGLASRGSATETLLKYARYCLAIAHVVHATPPDRSFTTSEIDGLAREWAARRVHDRRAAAPRWPQGDGRRSPGRHLLARCNRQLPRPAVHFSLCGTTIGLGCELGHGHQSCPR